MNKEQGYTLLELIITIGLISIAIGLSSFGLNVIYTSNVGSYASQVTNDIKLVQTKEMASNGKDYRLILDHDGSKYTVLIQVRIISNYMKLLTKTRSTIIFFLNRKGWQ